MTRGRYAFRTFPLALISSIALAFSLFSPTSAPATTQSFATDLTGKQIDPLKSSPGKIVILIFVRTDCPISNRYAPAIQRLSTQFAQNASFFLVYPARAESPAQIRKHEKDFNYKLPALRDLNHTLVKQSHATRRFRRIDKELSAQGSDDKVNLEDHILNTWIELAPIAKPPAREFKGALKLRHWLAHGRYWQPQLARRRYAPGDVFDVSDNLLRAIRV